MIVGFSRHGKGDGSGVVGYISDGSEAVDYVASSKKAGKPRESAPVVIRGDPAIARHLIDLVPHLWKYTSGMISFSPGERITPEMERRVIDGFEQCAFAGLDRNRYYTLWVRHTDGPGGCHHMHLVTPRMDLLTGKSLNIAPPGKASRDLFDTFRSKINVEFGLSDPSDPARIQAARLPRHVAKLRARERNSISKGDNDPRIVITRHIEAEAREGLIKDRDGVVQYLQKSGFNITREGNEYLTIQDGKTGERLRLRGGLYDRRQCSQVLASVRDGKQSLLASAPERLRALEEKLNRLVATRAQHNRERYGVATDAVQLKETLHDRPGVSIAVSDSRDGMPIRRTRGCNERALDCFGDGTRRLECASRNLVQTTGLLDRAIEGARIRRNERQLTQRLIGQYGALLSTRSISRERGLDREMEREFL